MAVTIYDIAKKAETSPASVSFALRDRGRISEKTRQKIKRVANELGYYPNPLARGLVGSKTKTIAFVINPPNPSEGVYIDLFGMERFWAIARTAATHGYKLFLHNLLYHQPLGDVLREIKSYGVDGAILYIHIPEKKEYEDLEKNDLPIVLLGRDFHSECVTSVMCDDEGGARQAVSHLLALGHTKIAFVGARLSRKEEAFYRRLTGYKKAMKEAGLKIDPEWILDIGLYMQAGKLAGLRLGGLNNRPSAIMAATDQLAIGIVEGLRECNIKVPDQMSVIGFDNLHMCEFITPKLTSVDMSHGITSNIAIESLLNLIKKKTIGEQKLVPVNLVVRDSTSIYREDSAM